MVWMTNGDQYVTLSFSLNINCFVSIRFILVLGVRVLIDK